MYITNNTVVNKNGQFRVKADICGSVCGRSFPATLVVKDTIEEADAFVTRALPTMMVPMTTKYSTQSIPT